MHAIPLQDTAAPERLPFYRQLYFQVVLAIVLGVLLGHFEPQYGAQFKPLGDAFIKLVKMVIAPVIFLTIVTGIAGMTHLRTVGRVFGKAMAYFLFFSTLALIVGMVFFVADSFPFFHEFGAWSIGCLFCFYYSATAISQEERASKRLKYGLYALLLLLLIAALALHDVEETPVFKRDASVNPVLKLMGVDRK